MRRANPFIYFLMIILGASLILSACAPKQNTGNRLNGRSSSKPDTPLHPTREGHRVAVHVEKEQITDEVQWPSEVRIQDVSVQEVRRAGEKIIVKSIYSFRGQEIEMTLEGELQTQGESNIAFLYQTKPASPRLLFGDLFCQSTTSCLKPKIEIFYRTPEGLLESVQVFASSENDLIENAAHGGTNTSSTTRPTVSVVFPDSGSTSGTQAGVTVSGLDEHDSESHDESHDENHDHEIESDEKPGRYVGIPIEDERALIEIANLSTPTENLEVVAEAPAAASEQVRSQPAVNLEETRKEVRRAQRRPTANEFLDGYISWVRANQSIPDVDSEDWRNDGKLRKSYKLPQVAEDLCLEWKDRRESNKWASSLAFYFLTGVSASFCADTGGDSKLVITAASLRPGGDISGHSSHENGLDIDIRYPRDGYPGGGSVVSGNGLKNLSGLREKTWKFIRFSAETGAVQRFIVHPNVIRALESYSRSIGEAEHFASLERKLHGRSDHHDHIHIQLYCSPINPHCQETKIGEE